MLLLPCKGAARKVPGKRHAEEKGREMRGKTRDNKSRMVEEQ